MKANAKDICMAEAKGKEKVALADLEVTYKPSTKARYEARVARADAAMRVAKEKCDDLAGNAKDVCRKEAETAHVAGKADAKAQMKTVDAKRTPERRPPTRRRKRARRQQGERAGDEEDRRGAQGRRRGKREAEYRLAKEKCDGAAGAAKDACLGRREGSLRQVIPTQSPDSGATRSRRFASVRQDARAHRPRGSPGRYSGDEPPLRSELVQRRPDGAARQEPRGRAPARAGQRCRPAAAAARRKRGILEDVCGLLTSAVTGNGRITPAGEWLLDNFYLIDEQIRTAKRHLPRTYSRELPRLAGGASAGLPRVYDLAFEAISHGDGRVDAESLRVSSRPTRR
jgi:hypothetical protein